MTSKHNEPYLLTTEFLVEPFAEGSPGPHVDAAVAAFENLGLNVSLGPFASLVSADVETTADAVADMIRSAIAAGATRLRIQIGEGENEVSVGHLSEALGNLCRELERDTGCAATDWDRSQKQAAVRVLHARGAFLLRGSVDELAELMAVSRVTIYNYLSAIEESQRIDG